MHTHLKLPALLFAMTFATAGYAQARGGGESIGFSDHRSAEPTAAQEGELLVKERIAGTNYCHMKFPAMEEDTLSQRRPDLKSRSSGDVIDFYGSCDYDPDGRMATTDQKHENSHWWSKSYNS
jgi:hypothetical protein